MVKIKNNFKIYFLALLVMSSFVGIFSVFNQSSVVIPVIAAEENSLDLTEEEKEKIKENEDEFKKLEEKAKAYSEIINLKQKQQSNLGGQITSLNGDIAEVENNIEQNRQEIEELNRSINDLTDDINKNEKLILAQKKIIAGLIRAYHEYSRNNLVLASLGGERLHEILSGRDRVTQTSGKIQEALSNIRAVKIKMEEEKQVIEESKLEIIDSQSDLEEKSSLLENAKLQKRSLLVQTQGEEKKYKELLARVEKQKQEILGEIDTLYVANEEEINELVAGLKRPTSGLASRDWYYSQKDSRWGNKKIGNSNSLMKDYGCAISSVAMVFTYYDEAITPGTLAKQPIFYWDLINWPADWRGIKLVTNTNHGGVNWSTVDGELESGRPVVVYIRAGGGGGHYVVVHHKDKKGEYVVHDPYFGGNIFLDSTVKLLSSLYKVSIPKSAIDQMIIYKK